MPKQEEWLNAREAAEMIGETLRWIRRATADRAIPHYKIRQTVRFRRSDLEAWLEEHRVEATFEPAPTPPQKRPKRRRHAA